jgi:hypothetical protein
MPKIISLILSATKAILFLSVPSTMTRSIQVVVDRYPDHNEIDFDVSRIIWPVLCARSWQYRNYPSSFISFNRP